MTSASKNSFKISSIGIPSVSNLTSTFNYNYYVIDESVNEVSGIPEDLKIKSVDQIDTESTRIALRLPRYITLRWNKPAIPKKDFNKNISGNLSKIFVESTSGKYFPYFFSSKDSIAFAYKDVNQDSSESSQATTIDAYVNDLLKDYAETGDQTGLQNLKQQITNIVETVESISDKPGEAFGVKFYTNQGAQIEEYSGFDQLISTNAGIKAQISALVLPDIFLSSSLTEQTVSYLNDRYNYYISNFKNINFSEDSIDVVKVGDPVLVNNFFSEVTFIGYIIDRFEILPRGPANQKTYIVENPDISTITDVNVKYGVSYQYSVRTVVSVSSLEYDNSIQQFRPVTYYVSSKPTLVKQFCDEQIPPPPPVDLNFVWNYRSRKLSVVWSMPPNSQRDIKQFQIFRRKSIYEPFELLKQHCFDFSSKKYTTGEAIDGNRSDMSNEELSFVEYQKFPTFTFVDDDFIVNSEDQTSSKFIYTITSVDAHGFISNYSAQFEVTFNIFKNILVKKLISTQGAPRPYPNMLLNRDLFRDVIKVEGSSSTKMKIYFMPEYFKVRYADGSIQKLVGTNQSNSSYRMQFINLQNQKTEALNISVEDAYNLANS